MTLEVAPELKKWVLDRSKIEIAGKIGSGTFGDVSKGKVDGVPDLCAIKELRPFSDEIAIKMYIREITTMAMCEHPCIVPLVGFVPDIEHPIVVTKLMVNRSLDHVNREMVELGRYKPPFRFERLAVVFYGVACGMAHLHKKDIIHRDLKPANILLAKCHRPCICDFGCAKIVDGDGSLMSTLVGTLLFMAPEIQIQIGGEGYTHKVDVYSFGMTMLVSLSPKGVPLKLLKERDRIVELTQETLNLDIVSQIVNGDAVFVKPARVPEPYWELIQDCLKRSPDDRPEFTEIMERMRDRKFATGKENEYLEYIRQLESYA